MTAKKIPYCTDEELLDELKKLGYNDVSPNMLKIMKDDLSQLISKEQYPSRKSVPGMEKESTIDSDKKIDRWRSLKQFHRGTKNISESENPLSENVAFDRENNYTDVLSSNREISKATSFEKYKNTLKSYKTGNYRRHESLTVDNREKLSSDILLGPSSNTECTEELHGLTNENYHPKRLETKNEKVSHPVLENSLKNYKTGNYRRHQSLTVDNVEKLSTDILHDPCSKTEYTEELHGITSESYKSKRLGAGNEKDSHRVLNESCPQRQISRLQRNFSDSDKSPISEVSLDDKFSDVLASSDVSRVSAFDKYKNTFMNYRRTNYAKKHEIALPESVNKHKALLESNEDITSETGYLNYKRSTYVKKHEIVLPETANEHEALLESRDDTTSETGYLNYKRSTYAKKHEAASPGSIIKHEALSESSNKNISSDMSYRSSISSVSLDSNKMKRKVLRHRDGKPVITEEFLDIPSIFNSSYPETQTLDSSKSFSSDDLSWKSNGSTGSIAAISPEALITPRSTFSLSSTRSLHSRLVNPRKKKNDPVAMYNYYKKFWNEFKPPGEKTHDKIRWAVRDKMLDYNV